MNRTFDTMLVIAAAFYILRRLPQMVPNMRDAAGQELRYRPLVDALPAYIHAPHLGCANCRAPRAGEDLYVVTGAYGRFFFLCLHCLPALQPQHNPN